MPVFFIQSECKILYALILDVGDTVSIDKSIAEDKYLKRQAILRINGKWVVEDWFNVTVKEFCRAKTDKSEDIQALILIYSNANLKYEINESIILGNKIKGSATLKIKVNAVYTKYYGE